MQVDGMSPMRPATTYTPTLSSGSAPPRSQAAPPVQQAQLASQLPAAGDLFDPQHAQQGRELSLPNRPTMPDWFQQRPYLTGAFLLNRVDQPQTPQQQQQHQQPPGLDSFTTAVQEIIGTSISACPAWQQVSLHFTRVCLSGGHQPQTAQHKRHEQPELIASPSLCREAQGRCKCSWVLPVTCVLCSATWKQVLGTIHPRLSWVHATTSVKSTAWLLAFHEATEATDKMQC